MKIVWIDVETTGLDPNHHEILTLGVVLTDQEGEILDSKEFYNKIKYPERAEQEALEINQINLEEHALRSSEDAFEEFSNWLPDEKYLIAGWNVGLDLNFLNASKIDFKNRSYHSLDVWPVIYTYFGEEGSKLEKVANLMRLENQTHQALDDVHLTIQVWKIIRKI